MLLRPVDWGDYELIDCGDFEKLERFGSHVTIRPEPQAVWPRSMPDGEWERLAVAVFRRSGERTGNRYPDERGEWTLRRRMPEQWWISYACRGVTLRMRLGLTSFKHVGVFPEQAANWTFIFDNITQMRRQGHAPHVLNLFAYTGGASLAARAAGAEVTHVDSVKQVVTWARENMERSGLEGICWIVDDAMKFVRRKVRRGNTYSGIILDPPSYGRGPNGEKWVLEQDIAELLECCAQLLEPHGFFALNLYSMGLSALLARTAVRQVFGIAGELPDPQQSPDEAMPRNVLLEEFGEFYFNDRAGKSLPLGVFYRFMR